jgi:hypothetical protein
MAPSTSAITALVIFAACTAATGEPTAKKTAAAKAPAVTGPIVVELFTSQGCSSCPPADKLLSSLATAGKIGDRAVVPLAFHVDYWNDLGWADPFSREAWTERQQRYSSTLGQGGRVYTPQLVIAGRAHVVGSNRSAVTDGITAAPAPAQLDASIAWTASSATITATAPDGAAAYVAIYEDDVTTSVERGENAGETLRNDHIVRKLEKVASAGKTGSIEIALDAKWHQLGAIVIAQGDDMTIVGTRALPQREIE